MKLNDTVNKSSLNKHKTNTLVKLNMLIGYKKRLQFLELRKV